MKKNKWLRILNQSLAYVIVAALASGVTMFLNRRERGKLTELQDIIDAQFIDEVPTAEMEDAAAEAMVKALGDRWSYYIPAQEYQEHLDRKHNEYVGIGVTYIREEGGCRVQLVEPEGGAKAAGILPQDLLIAVDGQDISKPEHEKMVRKLVGGKEGTTVNLTLIRDGEEMTLPVERKIIPVQVAKGEMIFDNIGLITIGNFNEKSSEQTIQAVDTLIEQGAESLIFDVRFNGGGYVNEMVKILDHLLPEGDVFRSVDYKGRESVDRSDADCIRMPMAVLMNDHSFSAAELFAAALREYDWATLVGEHTTGKGHFQYTIKLSDGSAVNLSTGRYTTPKGVDLEETKGLEPDITVPLEEEVKAKIYGKILEPEQDPQIQAAAEALNQPQK